VEEFSPYQTYSLSPTQNIQLFRSFWHSLTFSDLVWYTHKNKQTNKQTNTRTHSFSLVFISKNSDSGIFRFNEVSSAFHKKFRTTMNLKQLLQVPGVLYRFVTLHIPERVDLNIYSHFIVHNDCCPLGHVPTTNEHRPTVLTLSEFLSLPPLAHARSILQSQSQSQRIMSSSSNSSSWTYRIFKHFLRSLLTHTHSLSFC
jgi:hypothetical protein